MRTLPRIEAGIYVGNRYNKYESHHPVVRWLMSGFERGLVDLLGHVDHVRSVLEVGCGEGYITATLARLFPGARVLGTDISPTILGVARELHPRLEFHACDIYDAASLGRWDLVVACEVFEHLADPARALRAVSAAATGHVLATVPREPLWRALNVMRGRYWSALGDTDGHVQHWSRSSFTRFLAGRLDIVGVRAPLPWTQVLARPRRESAS